MAGRMGGDRQTVQNMWVYKVDTEKQLIYIQGHVLTPKGRLGLGVSDAVKRPGFHRLPDPKRAVSDHRFRLDAPGKSRRM